VSSPPVVPFTFQMTTLFVPPWMKSWNCWVVTTFTATEAGEIVMLMFVTGSVQVEVELLLEPVDVFVEHVIAVLAGAAPQEVRPKSAVNKAMNKRYFTAHLFSTFEIPDPCDSASILVPNI
jgi:hypothetical protein